MKLWKKEKLIPFIYSIDLLFLLLSKKVAFAQGTTPAPGGACSQYVWDDPDLVEYLICAIPNVFFVVQMIGAAIAIGLTIYLIFYTVRNLDNPKALAELGTKWAYLFIFAIIIATGGGIIFIPLEFIGFEGPEYWMGELNGLLYRLAGRGPESTAP